MSCAIRSQDGLTLLLTTDTLDTCTGFWLTAASDARNYLDVTITPQNFLAAFSFGVSLYLAFWYMPWLVKLAKQLINKL